MLNIMQHKKIKNNIFDSHFHNSILIKTGTIGDGSCFFHSLLTALSSTYRNTNSDIKQKYVKKLRNKISDSFNISEWDKFDGMEFLLQTTIYNNLKTVFNKQFLPDKNCDINKFLSKYPIEFVYIFRIFPFTFFDKFILPRAFDLSTKSKKTI